MSEWSSLTDLDVSWCIRRLPGSVRKLLENKPGILTLAGGFIRSCIANEPVNDIDLFAPSRSVAEEIAKGLVQADQKVWVTDNTFSLRLPCGLSVQFIHRWTFDKPELVVPSFDFTIARAAIWYDAEKLAWRSMCDSRFYPDLAAKRLVYCSPVRIEEAGGSMLRVLKFCQRGYRITLDSLGAVMARMAMDVRFENIPANELRGDGEARWAKVLTGLLREVDPNVDTDFMPHIPVEVA